MAEEPMQAAIRRMIMLTGVLALVAATTPARAQSYPVRPIRMVVPFAAGGPADTMARLVAQRLAAGLGQSVVVDNRPGAGGTIGARAGAAAEPDGYTVIYANTATFVIGPVVYANVGYDPLRHFAPVALVAVSYNVLVVDPSFPAATVPALIAHARAHSGKVSFASPGHGTPPHMIGEMFKQRAGIDIVHVPYKGTAAALTDIMAGQVEMTFENPSVTVPLVKGGKLAALAVTGETRNPQLPQVPTMIESGLADFVSMSFTGLMVPAGTPPAIIARLNAEIVSGLDGAEMREAMDKLGVIPRPGTPADFGAFLAQETARWRAVADKAGIRIE
jgi:tripartite-type tricarboxylate transporter receptor subunit TctC